MSKRIVVYGNPYSEEDPDTYSEESFRTYIRQYIFSRDNGRYRYSQRKHADIIVLSHTGKAFGHLEVFDKEPASDEDVRHYSKAKYTYLVSASTVYERPVALKPLSIIVGQYGKPITEETLSTITSLAGKTTRFLPGFGDERHRVLSHIVQRQGQQQFRDELLRAYSRRCAVTDCNAADTLEAAHIVPYSGPRSNTPSNGLLLRSDVHTLYDLGLLRIDPETKTVRLHTKLASTCYAELHGKPIRLPMSKVDRPEVSYLQARWDSYDVIDGKFD